MWSSNYKSCRECSRTKYRYMAKGLCSSCYAKRYREHPDNKSRMIQQKREWYFRYHDDNLLKRKRYREARHFGGFRDAVLERDGHICVRCGSDRNLVVHHQDRDGRGSEEPNNDLDNLETVCRVCHLAEHRSELEDVRRASRAPQLLKSGRWSLKHDCCVQCGSTCSRHAARGVCGTCYQRSYKTR